MGMTSKHQEYCTLQPTFILAIGPSFGVSSWREEKIACNSSRREIDTTCDSETKEGQLWLEDQTAGRCAKDGLLPGQWPWDHWIYGRRKLPGNLLLWENVDDEHLGVSLSSWDKNFRTFPNGPEIGPAFSSCSMIILFFVLLKSSHLPHVYTHGGFFWHFISVGVYEKSCYYCSGSSKMHVAHLQKTLRFLDGFVFRHSASTSFLFTPTCGQSWQWCRRHLHSYECTAIAKPWHMSWPLDFG